MTEFEKVLVMLLKEAIKIIHANSRNLNKDFLNRARATLAAEQKKRTGA